MTQDTRGADVLEEEGITTITPMRNEGPIEGFKFLEDRRVWLKGPTESELGSALRRVLELLTIVD
jgi:hypothetical protein